MDWPIASPGWDVEVAWVDRASMIAWGLLIWAGVAVILAVLVVPMAVEVVRRRRFWCARVRCEVEVEFKERGLPGFRRAAAVLSCSAFDPPTQVGCRRGCLNQDVRVRLPMTMPHSWRWP